MFESWREAKSDVLLADYEDFDKRLRELRPLSLQSYQVHAFVGLTVSHLTGVHGELTHLSPKQASKLGGQVHKIGRKLWDENYLLSMAFGFVSCHLQAFGLLPNEKAQRVYAGTTQVLEIGKEILQRNPIQIDVDLSILIG